MLRVIWMFSVVAGCCLLMGCERIMGEESDVEYTISGTLYKGMSDIPRDNAPILLEGVRRESFGNENYTTLGQTTTDEDGWFSFTYKKMHEHDGVQFDNGHYVQIRTDGDLSAHIETLPWNTNLSKDFAEVDHSRLLVEVEFVSAIPDTFFLEVPFPFGNEYIAQMTLPEIGDGFKKVYLAIPTHGQRNVSISTKLDLTAEWNNTAREHWYVYGFSRANMRESMLFNAIEGVEDNGQRGTFLKHGFPVTDTVNLSL